VVEEKMLECGCEFSYYTGLYLHIPFPSQRSLRFSFVGSTKQATNSAQSQD
jgi:hypothetical protein